MSTMISNDVLKSALIELAQSDRAFFVTLFTDILNPKVENSQKIYKQARSQSNKTKDAVITKIVPPYRQNVEEMRKKYAMDINVLLQLEELFKDAPSAEEFLQLK
jgi:hypothetical protein